MCVCYIKYFAAIGNLKGLMCVKADQRLVGQEICYICKFSVSLY